MSAPTTIRGRIAATNDKGIRLEGSDAWVNYSRYGKLDRTSVAIGADIAAEIDGRGFIRSLTILSAATEQEANGHRETRPLPCKDIQIVRESAIKSAAQFCASRPDLKSADLFSLAEKMEAWIIRGA